MDKIDFKTKIEEIAGIRKWEEGNIIDVFYKQIKLAKNLCRITKKGNILWNEPAIIDFLENDSCRTVRCGGKVRPVRIKDNTLIEVSFEEIKERILEALNCQETQEIRRHLIRNNIFFDQELLNNLKEEIPDREYDDRAFFNVEEGDLVVTMDEIFIVSNY